GKAVPVWQVQIKQDQMKIGMPFDQPHRLPAIRCLQHDRVIRQFLENAPQRVANQGVIVDQKTLHTGYLFKSSRQELLQLCQKSSRSSLLFGESRRLCRGQGWS